MPHVHIFGDSHTRAFGKIPNSVIHMANGMSMRDVGELGLRYDLTRWGRTERNDAVFVYGAVDARVHIGRLALDENRLERDVIHGISIAYVHKLRLFCDEWNLNGFVASVIPAVDLTKANPEAIIPTLGNLQERIDRATILDSAIRTECERNNLHWFDPHAPFRLPSGELDMSQSDKIVHLSDSCQPTVAEIFNTTRQALEESDEH